LHDFSSNDCGSLDANGGTQFKKSRRHNSVIASAKQTPDPFCEFFHSRDGFVPWQEEATGDVQSFKVIFTLNITGTLFCISVHKFMYTPNANAVSGKGFSLPCLQSPCCGSH
jgi:hypothetical protein